MLRFIFWLLAFSCALHAAPKRVALFVALCDNASQGIAPVPAKIGDGNIPAQNLYWGCDDGFSSCFRSSKSWKLVKREQFPDPNAALMERLVYQNSAATVEITAEAWRGSQIANCLRAFETALVSGKHDLCAFIGHNVLMDKTIEPPKNRAQKTCDAVVLCCKSEEYFHKRLSAIGVRPVLLTRQFMYPGAFILRDALPVWARGGAPSEIHSAAAAAYATNQKISRKAASGVFWTSTVSP